MSDSYDYDYSDPVDNYPREQRATVSAWADQEAWQAFRTASGDWKRRHAPSIGARARAILNTLLYPPSYITKCEEALGLYLSDIQNADRPGFWSPRRSNAPAVLKGVRHYG